MYPSDQSSNRTGIETNINAQYQIYWDGSQTSLLDSYGGSAAAYSLRALSSAYVGPLVRVRRASDNAEQDIYANYDGTLNTSSLESFCSGTNGFVKTWYDQSGNGYDATQTTSANQPQIVSSGSVILENGKPAMFTDGTNDFMNTANFSTSLTTVTASIVAKVTNGDFFFDDNATVNVNSIWAISTTTARLFNGSGFTHTITPNTWGNQNLIYFVSDAASSRLGLNNSFTTGTVGTSAMTGVTLGAAATGLIPNLGSMQEFVVYGSNKTSDLADINTNINDFYSIY